METAQVDEAGTTRQLVATVLKISQMTYQDGHHAPRSEAPAKFRAPVARG
ncbi:MAG TPA: hypothetical protein VIY90_06685 [Steroidobacteraceae bacterium]